jgi:hypothetical protein
MMTPTGIVRFFGFIGTAAFLGLAATSTATIRAQNDDQPPPPPPIAAADKPAAPPIAPLPAAAEDQPGLAPFPDAEEIKPAPADAPPAVEEIKPVPVDAPANEKSPEGKAVDRIREAPAIPRSPEPKGLEAPSSAAEPEPIAEAAPARVKLSGAGSPSPSEDPDAQARSFMERSRKEAESQLKSLNAEASQLRDRLQRIESGIRRWQALVDAMDRSEQELPERLEALPRAKPASAARRPERRAATVIHSTPEAQGRQEFVAGPDGVFRPVTPSTDADPVTRAQFVPAPTPR